MFPKVQMRSEMTKPQKFDDHASLSAPIEDLQVRIAFLDDLVEQLNQQLAIQTQEIAILKNKCNFYIVVLNLQIYRKGLHLLIQ
jgi:uncharacterized coiled-coil protein SlyX